MSESPPLAAESAEAPLAVKRRSPRWQLGLQRLILLIAAIAVWMTVYLNHQRSAFLDTRIKLMVPLANELIVNDPSKIAVVQLEHLWMDDDRWDLYLPGGSYRLCIATRKVADDGLAPVVKSVPLRPGNHRISLMQERGPQSSHVTVSEGKTTHFDVRDTVEWDPLINSVGGGRFSLNEQLPPDKPVVLYRRRFMQVNSTPGSGNTPNGTSAGILLWIERTSGSTPKP